MSQIFQKRTFYLDVPETKQTQLQTHIERLGGKIFLWMDSKNVTDIVTNKRIPDADYKDPKSGRSVPCNFGKDKIKRKHVVSSVTVQSNRMKKLFEKGLEQLSEANRSQELLLVAKQYQINVYYVTQFEQYLDDMCYALQDQTLSHNNKKRKLEEKEENSHIKKQRISRIDENQASSHQISSHEVSSHEISSPKKEKSSNKKHKKKQDKPYLNSPMRTMAIRQITAFKHPFILVEDFHHQNLLPFFKEFSEGDSESLPQLYYHRSTASPFCPSPESQKNPDIGNDYDLEIGFCSGCKGTFTDLNAHVESIVKGNATIKAVDKIFKSLKQ